MPGDFTTCMEMFMNGVWIAAQEDSVWTRRTGVITDTYKDGVIDPVSSEGELRIFREGAGIKARDTRVLPIAIISDPLLAARTLGSGLSKLNKTIKIFLAYFSIARIH